MNTQKYDLAVAYRVYPKVSSHLPPIFSSDKFKLAELCLKSFKNSLTGLKVKVWALLDNCPPAYEKLFTDLWSPEDLVLVRFPGVGDATTFHNQARILMEQTDTDIVYLAEDDYFYLPDQFQLAVKFIRQNPEVQFITPYLHPDLDNTELHRLPHLTKNCDGVVWNSCCSTTHTFLTSRTTLTECQGVFLANYGRISPDLSKWLALTKKRVFNPFLFVKWAVTNHFWAGSIFYAWYYCWRQILFGHRYNLWIPRPSIATHMVAGMEAPGVDWQRHFADLQAGTGWPKASE
jgi:hypothetical protein